MTAVSMPLVGESFGTAEYVEATGTDQVYLQSWEVAQAGGYLLRSRSSQGDVHSLFVDGQLETVWWKFAAPNSGIDIGAERIGNRIYVTGHLEGRQVQRTLQIDDSPWFQSIEKSLVPLALRSKGAHEYFWVVLPTSLDARKIQARNEGREEIILDGVPTEAVRVRISLPGFLAAFWSSTYWYRIPDGKFVRFEGLRGPPGTPLTIVRLVRELP